MDLRIFTEPQQGATYDDLLRVAKATEDLGFDAFFRSDRYLGMGTEGLPGPSDAWITLAGLARETSRIRLGTLMTSATFRLPGPLAISVANVDQMSGGRVELGALQLVQRVGALHHHGAGYVIVEQLEKRPPQLGHGVGVLRFQHQHHVALGAQALQQLAVEGGQVEQQKVELRVQRHVFLVRAGR